MEHMMAGVRKRLGSLLGPRGVKGDPGAASTWADLPGKPAAFNPAPHAHEIGEVTGLEGKVASIEAGDDDKWRVVDAAGVSALEVDSSGRTRIGATIHAEGQPGYRIIDRDGRVALEVGSDGRTRIHDPDFETGGGGGGPVRTNPEALFVPASTTLADYSPTYMDPRDRTTMVSQGGSTFRYSRDEGVTWADSHTFDGNIGSAIILDDGECLVAVRTSTGDKFTEIWRSSGWQADPAAATWTKVHTGKVPGALHSPAWSWSQHRNIIVLGDYGPKIGQEGVTIPARYVHLSRDYGKTWTQIFDLLADHPDATSGSEGLHIHGVCYDPYWDRIWVTHGDMTSAILYSDDFGQTWHSTAFTDLAAGPYQAVGIVALPQCILFASDGAPNGVYRISRAQGKHAGPYEMEIGYQHDEATSLTIVCQSIWRAQRLGDDAPVVFEFGIALVEGYRFILTTADGYSFTKVWQNPDLSPPSTAGAAYGPTASGQLLYYAADGLFTPGGRTLRRGPMPNAY